MLIRVIQTHSEGDISMRLHPIIANSIHNQAVYVYEARGTRCSNKTIISNQECTGG